MLNFIKKNLLALIASLYSLILALFFLAMRINYAGISKFLGADKNQSFIVMYLPIIVCIVFWLAFAFSVFNLFYFKNEKKLPSFISLGISALFTIIIVVIIIEGSLDYLRFILPHFYKSLLITAILLLFTCVVFFPIKKLVVKIILVALAIITTIIVGYDIKPNYFTYDAVVYAVEDNYQIVFSTNDNSTAWVEVNGKKYEDLYAGSMKSQDLVHKVVVPQKELDAAKAYTIKAETIIYRGPFGGYKGKILSKEHTFRPVNSNDGLQYYSLSDVHEQLKGAINAATYYKNMDFLVILGDIISMVETFEDANYVNLLANKITNGEYPVVYARGNHEIKGNYAEQLHKYVGSLNESFYYTFTLGNKDVYGITLDLAEDHDDGWWEYYGTDNFNAYRDKQTNMLEDLIINKPYEGYKYKMGLCHIPVVMVNYRHNHEFYKATWTSLLNNIGMDIVLSGHQHDLSVYEPGKVTPNTKLVYNKNFKGDGTKTYNGYLTDFNFVSFMLGRKSLDQNGETQSFGNSKYTGLYTEVDLVNKKQTSKYTNSLGNIVRTCNIFSNNELQESYTFDLRTK